MPTNLNLQDALDLINSSENKEKLMNDPRLLDFLNSIEDTGISILKDKDSNYVNGLINLLQACGLIQLMGSDDAEDIKFVLLLMTRYEFAYGKIVASILKYAAGLLAMEELR